MSPAEQARTAVAAARAGWLLTYPRSAPARPHGTCVAVLGEDGGRPVVGLARGSLAVAQLLVRPLGTLTVAPARGPAVTLQGRAVRLDDDGDLLRVRLEVGAVRLGDARAVPCADYLAADADPLARQAPDVLAHLRAAHADALAACLRAHGHDVAFVEPQALDRGGLDVLAVGPDGVDLVRLAFPAPVARLEDLRAGLAAPLLCRCRPAAG